MIREMYAEIQKQTDKHSVSELCEIYGVSRSGYYKWLKRAGQLNRYEKTHKILDSYVLDIHSHHPMMGYRQIRDKLYLEFGWIVSDPTVWKSMKRLRIHGYTRRRKAAATGTNLEHIRYANVLNRKFKACLLYTSPSCRAQILPRHTWTKSSRWPKNTRTCGEFLCCRTIRQARASPSASENARKQFLLRPVRRRWRKSGTKFASASPFPYSDAFFENAASCGVQILPAKA